MVIIDKLYLYPANYFYSDIKDEDERRKKWLLTVGGKDKVRDFYMEMVTICYANYSKSNDYKFEKDVKLIFDTWTSIWNGKYEGREKNTYKRLYKRLYEKNN